MGRKCGSGAGNIREDGMKFWLEATREAVLKAVNP